MTLKTQCLQKVLSHLQFFWIYFFLHRYLRKVTHSHISFLNYWAWVNTPLTGITASERGTSVSAWHFDFGIFTHTSFQICSSFVKFLLRVVILFQSNWHSETDSLKILACIFFGSVSQSVPLLPVCATQKHCHSIKLLPLCFPWKSAQVSSDFF